MPQSIFYDALGRALRKVVPQQRTARCATTSARREFSLQIVRRTCLSSTPKAPRIHHVFSGAWTAEDKIIELVDCSNSEGAGDADGGGRGGGRICQIKEATPSTRHRTTTPERSLLDGTFMNSKQASRRKVKARRRAPSEDLTDALRDLGHHQAVPPAFLHKVNLSYRTPRIPSVVVGGEMLGTSSGRRHRPRSSQLPSRSSSYASKTSSERLSLPGILASHLRLISRLSSAGTPGLDEALPKVYNAETMTHLDSRGYDIRDVMTWAWVLTARSTEEATLRMWAAENQSSVSARPPKRTPTFVFLFILRRDHLKSRDLKMLVAHAWTRLKGTSPIVSSLPTAHLDMLALPESSTHDATEVAVDHAHVLPQLDESTIMTMIIRLLRHARKVWPQSIVSITEMIVRHVDGGRVEARRLDEPASARLSHFYNRVLSLLSLPSTTNPYLVLPHHQRAQFMLIQRMSEFDPPLPVTQEGYRAVTTVQVAHKKTTAERTWAAQKALSWPPWKEERLGTDLVHRPEDGQTRASQVMTQMQEAGYGMERREQRARIFAGWDTDQSPTIQTRAFLERSSSKPTPDEPAQICAARIRATRTVDEAWACFLRHQDDQHEVSAEMYHAMFEKITSEHERRRLARLEATGQATSIRDTFLKPRWTAEDGPAAGDSREVRAPPTSPREAMYLRAPVPKLLDLFDDMLGRGLKPSKACLALLVSKADSLRVGHRLLSRSQLVAPEQLHALSSSTNDDRRSDAGDEQEKAYHLGQVPNRVFSAYVDLLARRTRPILGNDSTEATEDTSPSPTKESRIRARKLNPILSALRLVQLRASQPCQTYRPPWNAILSAIARHGATVTEGMEDATETEHDILCWPLTQRVIRAMQDTGLEPDSETLHTLCVALEKAKLACHRIGLGTDQPGVTIETPITPVHASAVTAAIAEIQTDGPSFLKATFRQLVGVDDLPCGPGAELTTGTALGGRKAEIDPSILLPPLLAVPSPAHLHAYVRVLGLYRDFDGFLGLVHWMVKFDAEVQAVVNEQYNGRRMMRRTLIAIRLFLEGGSELLSELDVGSDERFHDDRADDDLIAYVRGLVEGQAGWGGWPDDEEVEAYRQKGRPSES